MDSDFSIFDRKLLHIRRSNIIKNINKADFLIKRSLTNILETLSEISRSFPNILNLGSRIGYGYEPLSKRNGTIEIIDTDLSHSLLALNPNPNKLVVDEEYLPFSDNKFDLVISILNLHLINDLPGTLIQLKNILKPGGLIIASLFGENNLPELKEALIKTEMEIFSGISPRTIPNIQIKQLGGLLQRAGFTMQIVDLDQVKVNYPDPISLLHDLKNMGETNILLNRNKKYLGKKFWHKFSENYQNNFSNNKNEITASFDILTFTAIK